MTAKTLFRASVVAVLTFSTTLTSAQSLAGLAKKAEENSAKTTKDTQGAKTYSNDNLKNMPQPDAAPAKTSDSAPAKDKPETTSADAKSAASSKSGTNDDTKNEAYWRGRAAPIKTRIAQNEAKFKNTRRRIDSLTAELSGIGALNARRGGVETERQRLITEQDRLLSDLAADGKALNDVEEEGRRAGALPGWFRD
jgi:hypothetical protein